MWQVPQLRQNLPMSFHRTGHQNQHHTYSDVRCGPKCPSAVCALSNTSSGMERPLYCALGRQTTSSSGRFLAYSMPSRNAKELYPAGLSRTLDNVLSEEYHSHIARQNPSSDSTYLCRDGPLVRDSASVVDVQEDAAASRGFISV